MPNYNLNTTIFIKIIKRRIWQEMIGIYDGDQWTVASGAEVKLYNERNCPVRVAALCGQPAGHVNWLSKYLACEYEWIWIWKLALSGRWFWSERVKFKVNCTKFGVKMNISLFRHIILENIFVSFMRISERYKIISTNLNFFLFWVVFLLYRKIKVPFWNCSSGLCYLDWFTQKTWPN